MAVTIARPSRFANAAPLVLFLVCIGLISYAGRDQLANAVEASGAFVAHQFGFKQRVHVEVVPQDVPSAGAPAADAAVAEAAVTAKPDVQPADGGAAAAATPSIPADSAKEKLAAPKVVVEIEDKGRKLQILDAPIPDDCYPEKNADYGGDAVVWGLGHKKTSAAECCAACKEHALSHPSERPCNAWVWCGDPSGVCWTMDIHNHTTGDCWLKHQAAWDNNPDLTKSNLAVNHRGKFPEEFRSVHKSAPELVPWMAGVVVPTKPAAQRRSLRGAV